MPWGSCLLTWSCEGRPAFAPPPCVCGEVYLTLPKARPLLTSLLFSFSLIEAVRRRLDEYE